MGVFKKTVTDEHVVTIERIGPYVWRVTLEDNVTDADEADLVRVFRTRREAIRWAETRWAINPNRW